MWQKLRVSIRIIILILLVTGMLCGCISCTNGLPSQSNTSSQSADGSSLSISMPKFYAERMVLQQNKPIVISGSFTGDATADNLNVSLQQNSHQYRAQVQIHNNGFTATIAALQGSLEPYQLTITYANKTLFHLNKVYIGDIFVAAGQSNMELNYYDYYSTTEKAKGNLGSAYEIKDLPQFVNDSNIYFIKADHDNTSQDFPPTDETSNGWLSCNEKNAQYLGYLPQLFAQQLRKENPKIPVGIIQTAWGGTPISRHIKTGDIYANHIAPLQGFHIAGVLWYQGCNDAWQMQNALAYQTQFADLINQYREIFDEEDLPFLYVQLARWGGAQYTQFVRQAQLATLQDPDLHSAKNVAMTVSIDTDKGTSSVIHPLGKDILAIRMANQWKAITQGNNPPSGPLPEQARCTGDGTVELTFQKGTAQGLQAMVPNYSLSAGSTNIAKPTTTPIQGFEVSDASGNFVPATATIKNNRITLKNSSVKQITQIRYLWSGDPTSASLLYNSDTLPASPFILAVSS